MGITMAYKRVQMHEYCRGEYVKVEALRKIVKWNQYGLYITYKERKNLYQ